MLKIHDLDPLDRPRERLKKLGPKSLSDSELLAVIIGSGTRSADVRELARRVLSTAKKRSHINRDFLSFEELQLIPALGISNALRLTAACEYFSRRLIPQTETITNPADLLPCLRSLVVSKQEYFFCASLNGAHELISSRIVAIGLVNRVEVHPREIFSEALIERACGIIIAHNHQSTLLEPSPADIELTRRLIDCGALLGIPLLDHIIFNSESYYSFCENKLIFRAKA